MELLHDMASQHLVICANVLIKKADRYLMLKRSPHKKYAPNYAHPVGGKSEAHENPYETAIREVAEETGLHITNITLKAVLLEKTPVKENQDDWLIYHFCADYESGEVIATDEGELLWLSSQDILSSHLFPSFGLIVEHMLSSEAGVIFATIEYDADKKMVTKHHINVCH